MRARWMPARTLLVVPLALVALAVAAGVVVEDRDGRPAVAPGTRPPAPAPAKAIGQRIMTAMNGTTPSRALRGRIRRGEVGGVILFSENIRSQAHLRGLVRSLQRPARAGHNPPLLIAIDQEGGTVKRLPALPPAYSAAGMGRSPALARREGARTGRALRALGVNVDLAPVADVPHSASHFLGSRAFSRDARRAALAAAAFASGLQRSGVAATAKHFPGLGHARANTDFAAVAIRAPRSQLRADYRPFAALVRGGVRLVMLSNAAYPALGRSGRPAAMSRRIVEGELRRRLGFAGVTISDSLGSPAITRVAGAPVAVAAAGTDVLLFVSERVSAAAFTRLLAAARSGVLARRRLAASAERIRDLKESFGGRPGRP